MRSNNKVFLMKRITTILLSMFALLVALHPAVAFHYCSGSLASMELFAGESKSCCCPSDATSNLVHENNISENGCCNTVSVEVATDDYLIVEQTAATPLYAIDFICLPAMELSGMDGSDGQYSITSYAPPEHLFKTGREILSRICVYLI